MFSKFVWKIMSIQGFAFDGCSERNICQTIQKLSTFFFSDEWGNKWKWDVSFLAHVAPFTNMV